MRKTISPVFAGLSAWLFSACLMAVEGPLVGPGVTGEQRPSGETVGADVGAGPHRKHGLDRAGKTKAREAKDADEGSASTGSSSVGSSGKDNDAIEADEERATRNKDKFKRRPGYKEDVSSPRASGARAPQAN